MSDLIKPKRAAEMLGISQAQLRALTKSGDLPCVNIGLGDKRPRHVFDPTDLEHFIQVRKNGKASK